MNLLYLVVLMCVLAGSCSGMLFMRPQNVYMDEWVDDSYGLQVLVSQELLTPGQIPLQMHKHYRIHGPSSTGLFSLPSFMRHEGEAADESLLTFGRNLRSGRSRANREVPVRLPAPYFIGRSYKHGRAFVAPVSRMTDFLMSYFKAGNRFLEFGDMNMFKYVSDIPIAEVICSHDNDDSSQVDDIELSFSQDGREFQLQLCTIDGFNNVESLVDESDEDDDYDAATVNPDRLRLFLIFPNENLVVTVLDSIMISAKDDDDDDDDE